LNHPSQQTARARQLPGASLPKPPGEGPPYPKPGHDRFGQAIDSPPVPVVAVQQPAAMPLWPDPKNTAYTYSADDPMPELAEPGVLEALAGARGASSLDEALGAVRTLDRLLGDATADARGQVEHGRHREWADRLMGVMSKFGRARPPYRAASIDIAARRAIYAGRCRALAQILEVEPGPPIDPRYPTVAAARAELGQADEGIAGLGRIAGDVDRYGRRGVVEARTVAEIDDAITALAEAREAASKAGAPRTRAVFGQDTVVAEWNHLARVRVAMAEQIIALEAADRRRAIAAADSTRATAARVESAVKAAGGTELVVSSIIAALTLLEPVRPALAELDEINEDMDRLCRAGINTGPAVDSLRARGAVLITASTARSEARVSARNAKAAELVEHAAAGEPDAVSEIVALAEASPHAFPAHFAERIDT
jgi:hypothetical protein